MTATAIVVQEKPILFSGAMVRKIIEDLKTNTRRVVQPQPPKEATFAGQMRCSDPKQDASFWWMSGNPKDIDEWMSVDGTEPFFCPYGKPGDRLWVRETWQYFGGDEYLYQKSRQSVAYKATWDSDKCLWKEGTAEPTTFDYWPETWRPSIHMPRWASRLTLEIVSVKVERVQEISQADAKAEGVTAVISKKIHGWTPHVLEFSLLWDSINAKREGGKYAWAANPFVWAISFKKVEGPTA